MNQSSSPIAIHIDNEGIITYKIEFLFIIFYWLDSGTAAERIRPWRHSSATDETGTVSSTTSKPTSTTGNDPNLHPISLRGADFTGAYQKSSEYMGEYATTTKPEEQSSRPNVRDLFNQQSKNLSEPKEKNPNNASDQNVTRLWTLNDSFISSFLFIY